MEENYRRNHADEVPQHQNSRQQNVEVAQCL